MACLCIFSVICILVLILTIGQFQKISIHHDGGFLDSGGKGGSLNWNSEGKEGLFALEFSRHGGALTSGILKALKKMLILWMLQICK